MGRPRKNRNQETHSTVDNPNTPPPLAPRFRAPRFQISDPEGGDQDEMVRAVLDEIGSSEATIQISRRKLTDTQHSFLDKIPASNFSMELLKELYGGGDYICLIRDGNGKQIKQIRCSIDFSIPSTHPKSPNSQPTQKTDNTPDIINAIKDLQKDEAGGQGGRGQSMMEVMLRGLQQQNAALLTAIVSKPATDSNSELVKILLEERRHKSGGIREFAETLKLVRELDGGRKGKDGDEEDGVLERIIKGLTPIGEKLAEKYFGEPKSPAELEAAGERAQLQRAEAAAPVAAAVQPDPQKEEQDRVNIVKQAIVDKYLESIFQAAAEDRDPEKVAMGIVAMSPKTVVDELFDTLLKPDWYDLIFGKQPRFLEHKEWIEELREAYLDEVDPPDAAELARRKAVLAAEDAAAAAALEANGAKPEEAPTPAAAVVKPPKKTKPKA